MRYYPDGDQKFNLDKILNHGIIPDEHFRGGLVEFSSADDQQEIQHNLGYTPTGFHIMFKSAEMDIWAVRTAEWDKNRIFLETNVLGATVRIFIF